VETVVLGGGVTDLGDRLLSAVTAALREAAEAAPFLAALDLPERVRIIPPGSDVAALGAAVVGAAVVGAAVIGSPSAPRPVRPSAGMTGVGGEGVSWRS
jgi:predicted NBD/HSP70 family sugar kinase